MTGVNNEGESSKDTVDEQRQVSVLDIHTWDDIVLADVIPKKHKLVFILNRNYYLDEYDKNILNDVGAKFSKTGEFEYEK